jgi:hypothetical protein
MLNFAEQTGSGAVMLVWSFPLHRHAVCTNISAPPAFMSQHLTCHNIHNPQPQFTLWHAPACSPAHQQSLSSITSHHVQLKTVHCYFVKLGDLLANQAHRNPPNSNAKFQNTS